MERTKWLNRRCDQCFGLFPTSRRDARYCSPACRLKKHRKRVRMRKRSAREAIARRQAPGDTWHVQYRVLESWIDHTHTTNILLARAACRELLRMDLDARIVNQRGKQVYPEPVQTDDDRKALATG